MLILSFENMTIIYVYATTDENSVKEYTLVNIRCKHHNLAKLAVFLNKEQI